MARLKIFTFPDSVLAQNAQPVERVEKKHRLLADDMLETMYDAPGIGLAANQAGVLARLLVMDTEYEAEDDFDEPPEGASEEVVGSFREGGSEDHQAGEKSVLHTRKPMIIINPEIIHREGELVFSEGCLSVPDYTAEVRRAEKIKIKYWDVDGLEKVMTAEGLQAVCLQHEMDHLDGRLFIERLSQLKMDMAKKKLIKERKKRERGS